MIIILEIFWWKKNVSCFFHRSEYKFLDKSRLKLINKKKHLYLFMFCFEYSLKLLTSHEFKLMTMEKHLFTKI